MKKILLLAQTEQKSKDAEKLFENKLQAKRLYVGGSSSKERNFQAIVIYLADNNEINFIKDLYQQYKDAPIKVFLTKQNTFDASAYKTKSFKEDEVDQLIGYLQEQYNQFNEVMSKIFNSFDKDNSGFIDLNELNDVAKELGRPLDAAELDECMKDLDANKDGKISFEEFSQWWLSGRQGLSALMRTLLAFKIKTLKFVDQISGTLREVVDDATKLDDPVSTNKLSININNVENAGLTLCAKVMILSEEAENSYNEAKALHKFDLTPDESIGMLTLSMKLGASADQLVQEFKEMLQSPFFEMMGIADMLSVINTNGKASIAFKFPSRLKAHLAPFSDILTKIQKEHKVDQSLELTIKTAASPNDILKEGADPILLELLKGINIEGRLTLWKKLSDVVFKLIESGEIDPSVLPIVGGLSPVFLLKLNGSLDLTIDDYMKEKITSNPLVEPILLDAFNLIQSMFSISIHDDEEVFNWIKETIPAPFDAVATMIAKYLGDELHIQIGADIAGVKVCLKGEGLNSLARTLMVLRFSQ